MSQKTKHKQSNISHAVFRLNPLSLCIRSLMAGGLYAVGVVGCSYAADLPVPFDGAGFVTYGSASLPPSPVNTLQVNQHSDRAILRWKSFDVGKKNEVKFVQPSSSSIALNRINDSDHPSNILGTITANGQIYLVNKNGFVFDSGSVVNVNTLVASALDISDEVFKGAGIVQYFDKAATGPGQAALSGQPGDPSKDAKANALIRVNSGANIKVGKNGNVILAAPTVENAGKITGDINGQIMLVASKDKVYLQPAAADDKFAGLLVEVGTGGKVTNAGEIATRQGNITLAGFMVNQNGRLSATTSTNINGSIRLLAREGGRNVAQVSTNFLRPGSTVRKTELDPNLRHGTVKFGGNSSTSIVADSDTRTAIDDQQQKQSFVEVSGNKISMASGAAIVAPNGKVDIEATDNPKLDVSSPGEGDNIHVEPLTGDAGRIRLEKGSKIDVSGYKNIKVPMERNVAEVSVQSFNLRNSPVQKGGVLQGETVNVDVRKLPKILDASGALASIQRGIKERLGKGGEINLTSTGDVIVNSGSEVNISGGSVSYQDGNVNTTKLLSSSGRVIDIADANPNERYTAVFGTVTKEHAKWGVTEKWDLFNDIGWNNFERGYTQGLDAGRVSIKSPLLSWSGQLIAGSENSIYQRDKPTKGGAFEFNPQDANLRVLSNQNVIFRTEQAITTPDLDKIFPKNKDDRPEDLVLSTTMLKQSGITELTIHTGGKVELPQNVNVALPTFRSYDKVNPITGQIEETVRSNIDISAPTIDIQGSVTAKGGDITLNSPSIFTYAFNSLAIPNSEENGKINLGSASIFDVSGRWINDFPTVTKEILAIDSGSVKIKADNEINMNAGALIKADAGAWLSSIDESGEKLTQGKAGALEFSAGNPVIPGKLHLNGQLSAYGLSKGGELKLKSDKINIGSTGNDTDALNLGVSNGNFDFAQQLGFSKVTLESQQILTINSRANLNLVTQNRVLNEAQTLTGSNSGFALSGQRVPGTYRDQKSADSIAEFSTLETLPENLRQPITLNLISRTGIIMETGSSIQLDKSSADKHSEINFTAPVYLGNGIYVDGLLSAPGGSINLGLLNQFSEQQPPTHNPLQSIWLGANSALLTQGTTRLNPVDSFGRVTGEVLNGGGVSLTSNRGYVVFEEGSTIDVSGISTKLDIPTASKLQGNGTGFEKRTIGSDAGKISITAAEAIVLDGKMEAKAGTSTNSGGELNLILDRNARNPPQGDTAFPVDTLRFNVVQDKAKSLPLNNKFGDVLPDNLVGQATISANALKSAGFDDVRLNIPFQYFIDPSDGQRVTGATSSGEIRFKSDVNLNIAASINLDAQVIGWSGLNGESTGKVNLQSSYLQLGSSSFNTNNFDGTEVKPEIGGGQLVSNANWTQLTGASVLTGFKQINLNSNHDLRAVGVRLNQEKAFKGETATAANLNLAASQLYPSTLTQFGFTVDDTLNPSGQLTVSGRNTDQTPLSAGGKLVFNAPIINQNGIIKVPFGTIEMNAARSINFGPGSLTSVSGDGKLVPFGSIFQNIWLYPVTNDGALNLVFNEAPVNLAIGEKNLRINSPNVFFNQGSVVDVSAGGDLTANQFQPGIGGEFDYLNPTSTSYNGGFAILPSLGSALAPYDHQLSSNFGQNGEFDTHVGAQVFLNGIKGLPTGKYTILPPQYALLPGAFLVTPEKSSLDQVGTVSTVSGLPVVPGYQTLAGTNTRDSRSHGFLIESRDEVRKNSEYDIQTANKFFTDRAASKETIVPLLPKDSGQISIDASTRLILDGQFKVAAPNGRGAKLDISADNIKIVKNLSTPVKAGELEILDQDLSSLRVDSLLLGGGRKFNNVTGETDLTVKANDVIFDSGTRVQALDLVAAGKNSVVVKHGASITASGTVNTGESVFNVAGDSAILRVSADKQIDIKSTATSRVTGSLLVEQGARLSASKSMLLDGTKSTVLDGDIVMNGGALKLTANSINLGEISEQQADSLNLSNQKLASLLVDELVLNSRGSINLVGNVGRPGANGALDPIQFNRLELNAAALSGFENAGKSARIKADSIQIQKYPEATAGPTGTGTGTLELTANQFNLGIGSLNFDGFGNIKIDAEKQLAVLDNSIIKTASDLELKAGQITTLGGSKLEIDASSGAGHNVVISGNGNSSQPLSSEFGGNVSVLANAIALNDANIFLPSGVLNLQAQTGDILLNGKTNVNLAGRAVSFADAVDFTPGGAFTADAKLGKIVIADNTNIDVSTGGGNAHGGSLTLKAPQQTLDLLGNIKATGASAAIDVGNFSTTASFDSLMNQLALAGVSDALYFRTHNADIIQVAGNQIKATSLTLVADNGAIGISGTLNANGLQEGGDISLFAGKKITLENGSLITAKGSEKGGKVLLSSLNPNNSNTIAQDGIEIKSGSTIVVSGSGVNTGGDVTLRALRTADNVNIQSVAGKVQGYRQFYAEGVKKYTKEDLGNGLDANHMATIDLDTSGFMTAAAQNVASLAAGIRLRPGVEIDYDGDLAINNEWNFANQRFGQALDIPGSLVVAASGNLNINSSIVDGFDAQNELLKIDSWSFQLAAGSDLTSADKLVTNGNKSLIISANTSIHTGSGDIKLASGGNFELASSTSTVYTAGRADPIDPYGTLDGTRFGTGSMVGPGGRQFILAALTNGAKRAEYPIDGGELQIRAGGNIKGAVSPQFINQWLLRQGIREGNVLRSNPWRLTAWAVDVPSFQQNIGSFGGGNVDIASTGNITDLSVMMPTTGKQLSTDFPNVVQINGGGKMNIHAGGNIAGGAFFLGRGQADITAEDAITGSNNQFNKGPQIAVSGDTSGGKSSVTLNANQGITITGVSDPMLLNPDATKFFSYGGSSKLGLNSLSGDIALNSDISVVAGLLGIPIESGSDVREGILAHIYPASLAVSAFNGGVQVKDDILLAPAQSGQLSILAKKDISSELDVGGRPKALIMSDVNPADLPGILNPIGNSNDDRQVDLLNEFYTNFIKTNSPNTGLELHSVTPVHLGDLEPARIISQAGDISNLQFNLSKQAIIQAGRDLIDLPIQIQQPNQTDASIISAGRDLKFLTTLNSDGLVNVTANTINQIEIAGVGQTLIKTGRNLDLGASTGIRSIGNLSNQNLPKTGASLDFMVGLNGQTPDYAGFLKFMEKFLSNGNVDEAAFKNATRQTDAYYAAKFADAKNLVINFTRQLPQNDTLSDEEALEKFRGLKPNEFTASEKNAFQSFNTQLNSVLSPNVLGSLSKADPRNSDNTAFIDFIQKYLGNIPDNASAFKYADYAFRFNQAGSLITSFMQRQTGNTALTQSEALNQFYDMKGDQALAVQPRLNVVLEKVLFNELKLAGTASAADKTAGNESGFAAIDTLFPGKQWQGNLTLFFSQIQSALGGDINLLVPGGEVNAGLAVAAGLGGKPADKLGIVVQREGQINAMVEGDFTVNTSRVFTLGGGDILIWSSEGDIDAGKGAKSALSVTVEPPFFNPDTNQIEIPAPKITGGSGIRTASDPNTIPGDVFLFAPKGIVNAGEAGIAGNNVTISATAVLGANNIQVQGVGTGVPQAPVSAAAGLTGTSNLSAGVTQVAEAAIAASHKDKNSQVMNTALGLVTVDVLGFGEN